MEFGQDRLSNSDSFLVDEAQDDFVFQRSSMPEFNQSATNMQLIEAKDNSPKRLSESNAMSVSARLNMPARRRSNDGRYTRCIAIQKHPINLLIERFVKLLDATYAERLRKLGLYVGQDLRKRRTVEMQ